MQLNFEKINFQIKEDNNGRKLIYDQVRSKYVVLTPEEWVRQHLIHTLSAKGWSTALMSVEKALPQSTKRYDLIYYGTNGLPAMLAEVKAPQVAIDQKTLDQVMDYLRQVDVPLIILSNGLTHYTVVRKSDELKIMPQIPMYSEIKNVFLRTK